MSRIPVPLIAVMMAAILSACGQEAEAPADVVKTARIETVQAAANGSVRQFVGRVEAAQTVDIAFQVGGRLERFPVEEGQEVSEGDLIAQLELQDFRRAVRQAEVKLEQSRSDLSRQESLFERNAAPQVALENARTAYDLAEVGLDQARQNLEYATLTAPFDGFISRKFIDNFTSVQPGAPIARLQDSSELRVAFNVPEDLIALVNEADVVVRASFPFLPERSFPLEYRELVGEPDQASQTYRVLMALPAEIEANILPGMTANVTALVNAKTDFASNAGAVRVPVGALADAPSGGYAVWVYQGDTGAVTRRTVETGDLTNGEIIVTAGLSPGERIITAGVNGLVEGMRVRPLVK